MTNPILENGVMAERRRGITHEEYLADYGANPRPFILEGAAAEWPAMQKWSFDYFRDTYGDTKVKVYRGADPDDNHETSLAEYIDYVHTQNEENPYYLGNWYFSDQHPELMKDYTVPSVFKGWAERLPPTFRPRWRWFFIGPKGAGTVMHQDVMNSIAWNAVFAGKKRWVFFPPEQTRQIYKGQLNAWDPDFEKFPLAREAQPIVCIQNPGDIVYTPSCWWHQVENVEPCISITENFVDGTCGAFFKTALELTGQQKLLAMLQRFIPELA